MAGRQGDPLTPSRLLIALISSIAGVCFATLAALSIRAAAFPVRRFHAASIIIAGIAICLVLLALRAAITAGTAHEDAIALALRRGMLGAFVGLIAIFVALVMFGDDTRSFLAHGLNQRTSSFTTFPLLVVSVLLGFGAGFVIRRPEKSGT